MATILFRCPSIADDLQRIVADVDRALAAIEDLDRFPALDAHETAQEALRKDRERSYEETIHYLIGTTLVRLLVYADALNLPHIHDFLGAWKSKWPESTWSTTECWFTPEADGRYSPPFSELRGVIDAITIVSRPTDTSPPELERRGHFHLEHALRSIAKICRERNIVPSKESDLQTVVHSHLEGIFPDYVRNVQISKPILNFRPDGGVPSLKTAIECKLITSEQAVKIALHGLMEDLSGYAGSSEWQRYYTLCYMSDAFAVEGQITQALRASGNADRWSVVLVTGTSQNPKIA